MTESTTVPVKKTTNGKMQPFGFFGDLEEEMQRFFRWPFTFPSTFFTPPWLTTKATAWAPRTDVFDKNGSIVIKAELPGLKKEDVHVEIVGNEMVISGEAKADTEVKEEDYYRCERTYGSFYRRMPLPAGIAAEQIEATLADGVLEVKIPKPAAPKAETTKVEVK
jgi:HSP20 family protein